MNMFEGCTKNQKINNFGNLKNVTFLGKSVGKNLLTKNMSTMIECYTQKSTEISKANHRMTKRIVLKQFFTPQKYSNVLINSLEMEEPIKVIDFAMGECSLLLEAQKKWSNSYFYGNDLDPECVKNAKESLPLTITCFNYDIFTYESVSLIQKRMGRVDLCLGNPPFSLMEQTDDTQRILDLYGLDRYTKTDKIPAEVIYILQCLRVLKQNATLALILPDGFFVNNFLSRFRNFLVHNYQIEKIIELPKNIFEHTDAKTHILVLKNSKPIKKTIALYSLEEEKVEISLNEAICRMDFSYYTNVKQFNDHKKLSDFDVQFIRGKSKYQIQKFPEEYILHTTNFRQTSIFKSKLKTEKKLLKYPDKIARPNDIIVARVGNTCIGKIGLVQSGYFLITDCVFIVRIEDFLLRNKVYEALISDVGQKWLHANAKGVAARHITLSDIKSFPVS